MKKTSDEFRVYYDSEKSLHAFLGRKFYDEFLYAEYVVSRGAADRVCGSIGIDKNTSWR